jgi:hypothetical protein
VITKDLFTYKTTPLSKGARGASALSRDVGSHLAGRRIAMIAKTFLLAKLFRAYGTNFFRQEKSLRDHGSQDVLAQTDKSGNFPIAHPCPRPWQSA